MKIISLKKKKLKLLTNKQQESYENAKICYTCKKIENKYVKYIYKKKKKFLKLKIIVIIQRNIEMVYIAYII